MSTLEDVVKAELAESIALVERFPWEDPYAYATWLAQTFHMVSHSTRLVALAGAYSPLDRNPLHERFVDHAKEERNHQLLCISDLAALGHTIDEFPCFSPSAAMYQVQYYWIQHRGAVSFFGYTLALEALADVCGRRIHERVNAAHGPRAARFLKLHAEADVGHTEKAFEQLQALEPTELALVIENLRLSSDLYRGMVSRSMEFAARSARTAGVAGTAEARPR